MRITCPDCSAAYEVPPERVPPGRGVRCARCGTTWTPVALVDAEPAVIVHEDVVPPAATPPPPIEPLGGGFADPPAPAAPEPSPRPEPDPPLSAPPRPAPPPRTRRKLPVWIGWLVTAALLAALLSAAIARRAEIMHAWPPSERLYAPLGLVD